jgi:uncharacterized protein (TIGR03790 family)
MFRLGNLIVLLFVAGCANRACAGGSGLNVIVAVNAQSSNSLQLANEYCALRGVPPQNVLRLTHWMGGAIQWSRSQFEATLQAPLLAMVADRGLTQQGQFVLLSMDIPYRIYEADSQNGTTAALFYGFKTNTTPPQDGLPGSCSLPEDSTNSYGFSELPFCEARPQTAPTNAFLAMLLTSDTLTRAQLVLERGVASDSSFPTQTVYLERTGDVARNVRYVQFDDALFNTRVRGDYALARIDSDATAFTNLLGLQTGLAGFELAPNEFVPGAMGDSLTSYGGALFDNWGQTNALAFLNAGAAGSYGTVVEPCNFPEKFPAPNNYFYQSRGFALAEAYYLSLQNPFQGVLVGEPLSAPFAHRAGADWSSLPEGGMLRGVAALTPRFFAAATNLPLAAVDLFVDGSCFQTLTNLPPSAGNLLAVTLNGFAVNYTVPTNATVATVAAGLAAALTAHTNDTRVIAYPVGDRIELQALEVTTPGSNVTLSAVVSRASASAATTFLAAPRADFLDSTATGTCGLFVSNAPVVGDWLQLTVTKTNGTTVALAVTNTAPGTTLGALVQRLMNLVNATAALQSADGLFAADFYAFNSVVGAEFTLNARASGWAAAQIQTVFTGSPRLPILPGATNRLDHNLGDLRPRDHLYVSSGALDLPVAWALDTTRLADGYHEFIAVAYEGTSVRTQTRAVRQVRIENTALTATLTPQFAGSNAALGSTLAFAVAANTNSLARLELFTTGGSVGVVVNRPAATFTLAAAALGLGRHPFYALVTDDFGQQYRTQTRWIQIVPDLRLTLDNPPTTLRWTAVAGQTYDILATPNLAGPFLPVASLTATNTLGVWPLATPGAAAQFFRVRLGP